MIDKWNFKQNWAKSLWIYQYVNGPDWIPMKKTWEMPGTDIYLISFDLSRIVCGSNKKKIYQFLFEINYHKSESTLMPFRSIVSSVTSLLVCKYEPFWLGVSVESLILRWPLRPVGLWSLSSFHSCSGISITFLLELKVQMGIFKPPRSKICGGGVGGILFLSCHFVILSESKLELWYFTWVFLVTRPFFGYTSILFPVTKEFDIFFRTLTLLITLTVSASLRALIFHMSIVIFISLC